MGAFSMVKRIIQIQLLPTPDQAAALEETIRRFQQACNWVATCAFERKLANRYALHKLYYYDVRQQFELPAQMACLTPRVRGGRPPPTSATRASRCRFAHWHRCPTTRVFCITEGLTGCR